jgi:CheY-like chemotaxis protein
MSGIQGTRVLVADDDPAFRKMVSFQLTRAGCEVTLASDGQEAWGLLQYSVFDCLITDEQMPRLSGRELCRLVRSDARLLEMPIIIVASDCLELDPVLLREQMAVVRVLPKPYNPVELISTIKDCVLAKQQCLGMPYGSR